MVAEKVAAAVLAEWIKRQMLVPLEQELNGKEGDGLNFRVEPKCAEFRGLCGVPRHVRLD